MKETRIIYKAAFQVMGIATRTTNKAETASQTARIPQLWARFYQEQIATTIPNRVDPACLLAVYTDFESDEHGPYTEILGFEVANVHEVPAGLVVTTLPASTYAVFTTERGALPGIILDAWQTIWQMQPDAPGGNRRYTGDFELYDARSADPQQAEVDIYISIK